MNQMVVSSLSGVGIKILLKCNDINNWMKPRVYAKSEMYSGSSALPTPAKKLQYGKLVSNSFESDILLILLKRLKNYLLSLT